MATIIGGIAASHTPTIGFAYDRDKRGDPVWAPIFEAFDPVRRWVDERQPDVLLFIYNDHVTSFFFDHYSAFTLGVGPHWAVADEGAGATAMTDVQRPRWVGRDKLHLHFFSLASLVAAKSSACLQYLVHNRLLAVSRDKKVDKTSASNVYLANHIIGGQTINNLLRNRTWVLL